VRLASRRGGVRCGVLATLSFRGLSASSYDCFGETCLLFGTPVSPENGGCTEILVSTYETAWCFNPKDRNLL
jgi:hypothetical protein